MSRKLRCTSRKSFVELTETINAIPKGVYRLTRRDAEGALLNLGNKVQIGLIGDTQEYLLPLSDREGRARRMDQEEFLDQYYSLLGELKGKLPDFTRPFTICALDSSIARELH